jgi:hypothetical protein
VEEKAGTREVSDAENVRKHVKEMREVSVRDARTMK